MARQISFGPILIALSCLAPAFSADGGLNQLTPEEKAAGWQLLFDGKTMNGWRRLWVSTAGHRAWKVEDGCLIAQENPAITEDLVSAEKYRDFELEWDWKISPAGNSGLKYRIQDLVMMSDPESSKTKFEDLVDFTIRHPYSGLPKKGQEYVVGFEYQMIDNLRGTDAKYGPIRASGSLYSMVPTSKDTSRPVGEFNHSRLVVRGLHTEHWLNGVKVVDSQLNAPSLLEGVAKRWGKESKVYEMLSQQPRKDCPISLQNHGHYAWFRNVKIRRLP